MSSASRALLGRWPLVPSQASDGQSLLLQSSKVLYICVLGGSFNSPVSAFVAGGGSSKSWPLTGR